MEKKNTEKSIGNENASFKQCCQARSHQKTEYLNKYIN